MYLFLFQIHFGSFADTIKGIQNKEFLSLRYAILRFLKCKIMNLL